MSELLFLPQAWEDYLYMQSHDRRGTVKINRLIRVIAQCRTHYEA